jgi:transposase InsO family protein
VFRPDTSLTGVREHRLHISKAKGSLLKGPGMPWQTSELLTMKTEFVMLANQEHTNMRALCRGFQISAACGYKWLRAFQEQGEAGLREKSRRPRSHPEQTGEQMEQQVLELRAKHPSWGGRKLKRRLENLGVKSVPAASTITEILRRHGQLGQAGQKKQGPWQRFEYGAPNELWQMDFKGPVKLVNAQSCEVLTLLDDHSRFSLAIEACANQRSETVKERLRMVFGRYGLPERILCDNGTPWGSAEAACPYTEFSVWLLRLGVEVIHGRVYHPQTQGKEERFHGSLQVEVFNQNTAWRDRAHCQKRFSEFRDCYNTERPHEALHLEVPASRYRPSLRPMPEKLPAVEYLAQDEVRKVRIKGEVKFQGHLLYVGQAFAGLDVAFRATAQEDQWALFFGWKRIGHLDLKDLSKTDSYRLHLCHKRRREQAPPPCADAA